MWATVVLHSSCREIDIDGYICISSVIISFLFPSIFISFSQFLGGYTDLPLHVRLTLYKAGSSIGTQLTDTILKITHAIPLLGIQHFGKSMGVKHTVPPDCLRSMVAFTVLAQMCGPNAKENSSSKLAREGILTSTFDMLIGHY